MREAFQIADVPRSDMNNEKSPEQQKPQPGGSVKAPDTKTNPSPENQGQGKRPQEISKKNPSQGGEPNY